MSEERNDAKLEVRRLTRMLGGIAKQAREASLTGQLAGGKSVAVQQYNAILSRLLEMDAVPGTLFPSLPEDASFDEAGVAATQLGHYLRDDDEEGRTRIHRGFFDPSQARMPNLQGQINEIGDLVREYLPDLIKNKVGMGARETGRREPRPGADEAPAGAPAPASSDAPPPPEEIDSRLAGLRTQIQDVVDEMAGPNRTPEQMQLLSERLRTLSQEQAELARERR